MTKNTGGPAYPQGKTFVAGSQYVDMGTHGGMTLRDHFAGLAMQGMYACPTVLRFADGTPAPDEITGEMIAQMAYEQADAMLAEREK